MSDLGIEREVVARCFPEPLVSNLVDIATRKPNLPDGQVGLMADIYNEVDQALGLSASAEIKAILVSSCLNNYYAPETVLGMLHVWDHLCPEDREHLCPYPSERYLKDKGTISDQVSGGLKNTVLSAEEKSSVYLTAIIDVQHLNSGEAGLSVLDNPRFASSGVRPWTRMTEVVTIRGGGGGGGGYGSRYPCLNHRPVW